MAGRPRKPTKFHIIHGNPGKRPLPKNEPKPAQGVPTRPGWLSPEAKREWARVTKELEALGLLAKLDRALLSAYCQLWSTYVEAVKALEPRKVKTEDGEEIEAPRLTFTTDKGYVGPRPEIGVAAKCVQQMMQLSARFGFTPADRSKMAAPEVKEEDLMEAFIKRGQAVGS